MGAPDIEELQGLHDKNFAMLTDREREVLNFYVEQGRKYNISVSIISDADPEELARATSRAHAEQIQRKSNSVVRVNVMR